MSLLNILFLLFLITLIIIGIVLMNKASESGSKELMALGLTFAIVGAIFVIDPERLRRSGVLRADNHNKIQAETVMDLVLDQNVVDSFADYLDFKERR